MGMEIDELVSGLSAAMKEAENETADFACEVCDGEFHGLPMQAFLEWGEPSCPKCGEHTYMLRVHKNI